MAEFRLETPRLILRNWREADREANWQWYQDAEARRFLSTVASRAEADAKIDKCIASQAEHGHAFWAAERKADGAFIGTCGIGAPRAPSHEYEIGWRFLRAAWGQGYATEAARASLAWAWANLATPTIVAITVLANVASWRVMEKIGMTRHPEEDFDHPDLPAGDPLRAHILYRIHRPTSETAHAA